MEPKTNLTLLKMNAGIKITAPIVLADLNCCQGLFAASMNVPAVSLIIDTLEASKNTKVSFFGFSNVEIKSTCEEIALSVTRNVLNETGNSRQKLSLKFSLHIPTNSGLGLIEAISVSTAWAINERLKLGLEKDEILPLILQSLLDHIAEVSFSVLASCLFGGLRMSLLHEEKLISKRLSLPDGLYFNILMPLKVDNLQSTSSNQNHEWDAVSAATFVQGLERMDFELLQIAMSNWDISALNEVKSKLTSEGVLSIGHIGTSSSTFVLAQNDLALQKGTRMLTDVFKDKGNEQKIISAIVDQRGVYKQ